MRVPLSWLREFVDVPWGAKELGSRLTMSGFELEALERAAPEFSGVVVAEIVEATKHPQAEKLQVCKVRAHPSKEQGAELLQIVCGAANARAGLKTALATVGAKLPGDKAITAAKLRGVESFGMLCSAKVSICGRSTRLVPGTTRIAPFSVVLSVKATQAVITSPELKPQ